MTSNLELIVCQDCSSVQYPPREICHNCLSGSLTRQAVSGSGTVLSVIALHHTLEESLAPLMPVNIATVKLDAGGILFTYCHHKVGEPGSKTNVVSMETPFSDSVLIALPPSYEVTGWQDLTSYLGAQS